MIKANELRVGNIFNLVRGKGSLPVVIDEDIMLKIFSLAYNYALNDLEPIPLTPEWLERCGFEIPVDNGFFVRVARGVVCIKLTDIGLPIVRIGEMHFTNIKYLHQLQNLYFALTGEELTLKEPA